MAIILRTVLSGPKGCFQPGRHDTFTHDEERALIEGGYAEAVAPPPERAILTVPQKAVVAPPEQAASRNIPRRGR